MSLSDEPPGELRRLSRGWYQSTAWVHWTMSIRDRGRGWLTPSHHAALRELMIHVCARFHLICPAYCLMPDHGHFLFVGLADGSDQRRAMKLFRKHWNHLLSATGHELQRQAYEHVLDENERNPDAFEDTMLYILNNPVSAGLVGDWREWEHLGAIAAGYPEFDPRGGSLSGFRERFWKVHHKERRKWQGDSPP